MAKGSTSKGKKSTGGDSGDAAAGWTDSLSEAFREATKRASDLAQNPYAKSLLAAGLVAAAAALASNKSVREATRKNFKHATDAVEVGADNAGKIGVAIVNAATEAVQHLLSLTGAASSAAPAAMPAAKAKAKPAAKAKVPAKPRAAKPAVAKAPAAKAATTGTRKPAAKRTTARAKPAAKPKG